MRLERPSSITRAARACGLLLLAAAPSACAPQPTTNIPDAFQLEVSLEDRVFSCDPLRFDPPMPRVATERAITLRVSGGSGLAPLRIEGETLGAFVEAGGGFRAGSRAGRVTVLATDSNCNLQARTTVEIVGPFSVTPARATVARGGDCLTRTVVERRTGPVLLWTALPRDARTGRNPYLWTLLSDPRKRSSRLHEGLISTARILLLGLCIDLIYQFIVLKSFYPAEAVIIAGLLAFVPYLLLRGPIARVARWRLDR
jgi:hypothetical protein